MKLVILGINQQDNKQVFKLRIHDSVKRNWSMKKMIFKIHSLFISKLITTIIIHIVLRLFSISGGRNHNAEDGTSIETHNFRTIFFINKI